MARRKAHCSFLLVISLPTQQHYIDSWSNPFWSRRGKSGLLNHQFYCIHICGCASTQGWRMNSSILATSFARDASTQLQLPKRKLSSVSRETSETSRHMCFPSAISVTRHTKAWCNRIRNSFFPSLLLTYSDCGASWNWKLKISENFPPANETKKFINFNRLRSNCRKYYWSENFIATSLIAFTRRFPSESLHKQQPRSSLLLLLLLLLLIFFGWIVEHESEL